MRVGYDTETAMTFPTAYSFIATVLWASPVIQALAGISAIAVWKSRRREPPPPGAGPLVGLTAGVLVLHTGYILAPLWWAGGRYLLGAATMLPVAIIVVGSIAVIVLQAGIVRPLAHSHPGRRILLYSAAALLALAYIGPLLVMLAAWT